MLVSTNGLLSPTKLLEMSEGFSTYTSSTAGGLEAVSSSSYKGDSSLVLRSSSSSSSSSMMMNGGSSSVSAIGGGGGSKVGMALSSSAFAQAQDELVDLLLDPKGTVLYCIEKLIMLLIIVIMMMMIVMMVVIMMMIS